VLSAFRQVLRVHEFTINCPVNNIDIVACKLHLGSDGVVLNVVTIYIPPSSPVDNYNVILEYLEDSIDLKSRTILAGDFNIPDYSDPNIPSLLSKKGILSNFTNFHDLVQHNHILNGFDRLLDLVYASTVVKISVYRCDEPLVSEDVHHPSLDIEVNCLSMVENNFTASSPELRYNYRRANFPKMYAAFQAIVWDDVMHCQDVNSACHLFYTKILRVIDECVPLLKNGVSKYPPWFSKCTINSIVRKGRAWKSYKKTKLQMYKDKPNVSKMKLRKIFVLNTMNLFGLLKVESNLTLLIFGTTLTLKRTQLEYLVNYIIMKFYYLPLKASSMDLQITLRVCLSPMVRIVMWVAVTRFVIPRYSVMYCIFFQ
jgi:hypothetical protein